MPRLPMKQEIGGAIYNTLAGIYIYFCLVNLRFYIGRSNEVFKRQGQHFIDARYSRHHSEELSKDFKEFGYYNLVHVFLENDQDPYYVAQLEGYLIDSMNPYYNSQHSDKSQEYKELEEVVREARALIEVFDNAYLPSEIFKIKKGRGWSIDIVYNQLIEEKSYKETWGKKRLINALLAKGYVSRINDQWIVEIK